MYSLSNGAIDFLNNQNSSIKGRVFELNFIFKVNYIIKNEEDWYNCSLSDENSINDDFYIECKFGEPKKNDIIQTNKIKIYKLPNRDTNLFFCQNVKKLNELNIFKNNIKDNSIINTNHPFSKKEINTFNEGLNNASMLLNKSQDIIINNKLDISQTMSINIEKNRPRTKHKKYILISNLSIFTNNPVFYLKCKFKSEIKKIKHDNREFLIQDYLFYDTKGDEIQGVTFLYAKDFDNIIEVDSVYEISKTYLSKNNPKYNLTKTKSSFLLQLTKKTKIKKLEDNGDFDNAKKLNQNDYIKIDKLTEDKLNCNVNVRGIILEETNIIEIKKENGETKRFKSLIIGDDTLHRINLKLWDKDNLLEKKFSKGDIITVYRAKFSQYQNTYELNCLSHTEIQLCTKPEQDKELKDFYKLNSKTTEYIDMNNVITNSVKK